MCDRNCKRVTESVGFATELLREVKASARRWFIAFCVMVILEVATIIGFIWYISLPVDESDVTSQEINQDADGGNNDLRFIGGDNYGEAESEDN